MMQDAYESLEDLTIMKLKKNILKTYYQWWHDRETNENIRFPFFLSSKYDTG